MCFVSWWNHWPIFFQRFMFTDLFVFQLIGFNLKQFRSQEDNTWHNQIIAIRIRRISRNGPINWPSWSCDFRSMDYFLCEYVKSLVDKLNTFDHLEANVCRVIIDIRFQLLEKVIQYWKWRFIRVRRETNMARNYIQTIMAYNYPFNKANFTAPLSLDLQ